MQRIGYVLVKSFNHFNLLQPI